MNKPTVVLKNLKTFMGMEGQGFNVDVWINGIKCMLAIDSAQGGCFEYQSNTYKNPKAEQVKTNVQLLEAYIKSLPEYPLMIDDKPYERDGKVVMMKPDMDNFIDDMIVALQKAKEAKKMTRLMQTSFIFGVPNADQYQYVQYRRKLAEINRVALQRELDKLRVEYCKGNVQLLNTNISELELK
jgi:hypothetical protein